MNSKDGGSLSEIRLDIRIVKRFVYMDAWVSVCLYLMVDLVLVFPFSARGSLIWTLTIR